MSSSKFNFSQSDRILKIGGHILFIFIALIIVVSEESPLMSPMNILNKYQKTSELINAAKANGAKANGAKANGAKATATQAKATAQVTPQVTPQVTSQAIQQAAKGISATFNLTS